MPPQPPIKRTVAFFDGQNLFHQAKAAFGYTYPNYDPIALAKNICISRGWQLDGVRFYTGVPEAADNAFWHSFWTNKLLALRRSGAFVFRRPLRYRDQIISWPANTRIRLPDKTELPSGTTLHRSDGTALPTGTQFRVLSADEKGIDIRIAVDAIKLAIDGTYDVALFFSQDQDLNEVAVEIPIIASVQGRWIQVASAFPDSVTCGNHRGIDKTKWIPIDKPTYDACIDPVDYRPTSTPIAGSAASGS